MNYPDWLIARAKALMLCGLNGKAVANMIGVPYTTVREWRYGKRKAHVAPDPTVREYLFNACKRVGAEHCNVAENMGEPLRPQTGSAAPDSAPGNSPSTGTSK